MNSIEQIGIHVPTLVAQIANFLILVAILRFVLYKPLINIFEERAAKTRKLAQDLQDIEQQRKKASEEANAKIAEAEQTAHEVLERARRSTLHFQEKRLQLTEKEIDRMIEESRLRIQAEQADLRQELTASIKAETMAAIIKFFSGTEAGRVLHADLMDFARKELPAALKGVALPPGGLTAEITSAFAMRPKETRFFHNLLTKEPQVAQRVVFGSDPSLVAGVRLKLDSGYLFDFSFHGRLEKELGGGLAN